jgi:antitoxin (DNA-binding transcriptional repressor) of toxin-antitoxin stability system
MANRVSATDLARRLGDILGRIRYRGETFVIDRHNVPIAQIGPPPGGLGASLRAVATQWLDAAPADPEFADDLERIGAADKPPASPWAS